MVTRAVSRAHRVLPASALVWSLLLPACGGSGSGDAPAPTPTAAPAPAPPAAVTYSLAGSVTGLVGSGLVLSVAANGSSSVSVTANGTVSLAMALVANTTYVVTVATQPTSPAQVCSVTNGSGTVSNTNITDVTIGCAAPAAAAPAPAPSNTVPITATVSGLPGPGLMLQLNGMPNITSVLAINSNGVATFPVQLPVYTNFNVLMVGPLPPGGACTIYPSVGVAYPNGTNVSVMCGLGYSISYTVSGLSGSGLEVQLNDTSPILLDMNGTYSTGLLSSGTSYSFKVVAQPAFPTQTCSVVNGSGTINNADVTNIQVNCTTVGYTIVGTANGIVGSGLTLQLNGSNNVPVTQNGSFSGFPPALPSGTAYDIAVGAQPSNPTQSCTLSNAQGTIGTADVTDLEVVCLTPASSALPAGQNAYFIGTGSSSTSNSTVLAAPTNAGGSVISPTSNLVPLSPADAFVSVATDAAGNIYVGAVTAAAGTTNEQTSNPRVLVFPPGSTGAATPNRTIQLPMGSTPWALAVDGSGNIYVADDQTIYEFAPGASGTATPIRSLTTGCPYLAVDPNANIVCAGAGSNSFGGGQSVLIFAPNQSGNATPARSFEPGQAFVIDADDVPGSIEGLALDPSGNILMVVSEGGTLTQQSLIRAAGGTTSNDQGSLVASVNSILWDHAPTQAQGYVPFGAIQCDADGNVYVRQSISETESLLWQFAPQSAGGFALASSEAVNGALGSFAVH